MADQPKVFAFIDSQNLNLGIESAGWKLDFKKFRLYLKNKYHVDRAYLFIGQVPGNEALYDRLQDYGYHLIFKPTTEYTVAGKKTYKGNVDAELVLYASAKVYTRYDQAIVVSGDGDFLCLGEYLEEKSKLLHIMVPNAKYSKLLQKFQKKIVRVDKLQKSLEYKKDQRRRSVETLGVSGRGDESIVPKQGRNVNTTNNSKKSSK